MQHRVIRYSPRSLSVRQALRFARKHQESRVLSRCDEQDSRAATVSARDERPKCLRTGFRLFFSGLLAGKSLLLYCWLDWRCWN